MSQTDDLRAGKLEQTCRSCGRWEAAHWYCSFCHAPMTDADWYRNGDRTERAARFPRTAPAAAPSEFRDAASKWPATWGPWPGVERAPRQRQTPLKRAPDGTLGL